MWDEELDFKKYENKIVIVDGPYLRNEKAICYKNKFYSYMVI